MIQINGQSVSRAEQSRAEQSRAEQSRAGDVDLLRAFGIILMIMGHVWFGSIFDKWIHGFHMPLWFMISGYFLNTNRDSALYIRRKIKAIVVPYLFFGICYEIIYSVTGHNQWLGLIWPNSIQVPLNGSLWFLPALLMVDIIGFVVFKYLKGGQAVALLTVICILGCLHFVSLPFSIDSALVGCGFFLIGFLIRLYGMKLTEIRLSLALGLLILSSALILVNGDVNMRENEYAIIPLFWMSAILTVISLWSICKWIDTQLLTARRNNKIIKQIAGITKEIGSESLIYVCVNQFILFFLNRMPIAQENTVVMLVWHLIETIAVIVICFVANRIVRKTPLKVILGKF